LQLHPDGTVSGSNLSRITATVAPRGYSYDAALHRIYSPLEINRGEDFYPTVSVTNVGVETISFPIYVLIGKETEREFIDAWLESDEGEPERVWYDMKMVENLEFADTLSVEFDAWPFPPQDGTIGFASQRGLGKIKTLTTT